MVWLDRLGVCRRLEQKDFPSDATGSAEVRGSSRGRCARGSNSDQRGKAASFLEGFHGATPLRLRPSPGLCSQQCHQPMTLILALDCADGLLLASDGQATVSTGGQMVKHETEKLRRPWVNVGWGASGPVSIAQLIENALAKNHAQATV